MSEIERQRTMLTDAVGGLVDEEIVAIGYFHRIGTSDDSWRKGPEALRRLVAKRRDHPADHLGSRNVLVLTATRVLVVSGSARPPLVRVKALVGAWPLQDITFASKQHTSHAYMSQAGGSHDTLVIRATMTFAGGEAPLSMDFPRDALSRQLVVAMKTACGGQLADPGVTAGPGARPRRRRPPAT
jgi:hypothetical protein